MLPNQKEVTRLLLVEPFKVCVFFLSLPQRIQLKIHSCIFSMRNCFPKLHRGSINLGLLVQRIELEGCVWSYSYPYVHWDSTSQQVPYKHNPFWLNMKPLFYEVFVFVICRGIAVICLVQMVYKTMISCFQGCGNWCEAMLLGVLDAYLECVWILRSISSLF